MIPGVLLLLLLVNAAAAAAAATTNDGGDFPTAEWERPLPLTEPRGDGDGGARGYAERGFGSTTTTQKREASFSWLLRAAASSPKSIILTKALNHSDAIFRGRFG